MSAAHPHPYNTMPRAAVHSFQRFPLDSSDTDFDPPVPQNPDMISGQYQLGERSRYQPRRTSTLAYQNSGARDHRDRSYSRSSRNVVIVMPPPDLPLDRGPLGNVLSVGPRHRLPQGILMPLFPSMLGQLNAIAREYNFPSTAGLCLYLHITENGITKTPRISDDSWQYLFGHLFDGRPSSGGQRLPVGGSIEFDVDLNKARWFDAWISGNLRDSNVAFQPLVTSLTSFDAHWREESQTMNVDERPAGDRWNASGSHTMVTNSRPETLRHLPKKLSLVDRFDLHGVHVPPKSPDYPNLPESSPTHGTYASSPILQSAVPLLTESDLERRVNSWRAGTELYPLSMAQSYQPAPDVGPPAGVTVMDEYALERNFQQAIRIDEFLWSVTSAGPRSPPMETLFASPRPSSVHIDRRANGSAPLTPSAMTSWGPTDDDRYSLVSSVTRLPSPDMGERAVEDVMAPRLRAVWGNSFGWRSAMTWKQVYPYALFQTKPTIRIQLQDPDDMPQYPNLVIYPSTSQTGAPKGLKPSVWGSSFGWQRATTWRNAYPYSMVTMQSLAPIQLCGAGGLETKYPNLCIYPKVYPCFEIYPTCTAEEDVPKSVSVRLDGPSKLLAHYPSLVIYPAVYPNLDIYPGLADLGTEGSKVDESSRSLSGAFLYPNLVIYTSVYPHFNLYPNALQTDEAPKQKEVGVELVNVGHLTSGYPNIIIYPDAYPYLEIYPMQDMRISGLAWGISFGWLTAKTWHQVYPLHTAAPLTTRLRVDAQSRFISKSGSNGAATANVAVWGRSFGWKRETTWRAVWPTSYAPSPIPVHLGQQINSPSNYPYLVIYPSAYPHIDIYPSESLAVIAKVEESHPAKKSRSSVGLIQHYPNLVIYPAAYPHFDLYPAFARDSIVVEGGQSDLRRRRIDMWRVKNMAQVGLLANNHVWEAEDPLRVDVADYAWSRTSAGPLTPPPVSLDTPSVSSSVHIDRRVRGSVLRTPSTATTWGPQDVDWYSEIDTIERLPSPDLGQRFLDDAENIEFPHQSWHLDWPFFRARIVNFVSEYPRLIIYPPAYPHFELYPTSANVSAFQDEVIEVPANSIAYPALDIHPTVYPHFDIYPVIDLQIENPSKTISNVWHERVEVKLASMYPYFDIYHACYPYNLDYVYPPAKLRAIESTPFESSCGYPCLVVYPPVYPFVTPYPDISVEALESPPAPVPTMEWESVIVKLSVQYPLLDIYPVGYPWSLECIYPANSIDDFPGVIKPLYPCIWIYTPVYPFVQPYPSVSDSVDTPGTLDEGEYELAKASLALSELEPIILGSVVYPSFDLYPIIPVPSPQPVQDVRGSGLAIPPPQTYATTRGPRKTHAELHAAVIRSLEKKPARISKTHLQLHTEVFQDGAVRTPSGYVQDLSPLVMKKLPDIPAPEPRRPTQDTFAPRPPRSRSGTTTAPLPDRVYFPLSQPPVLPPLRIRSPVPSQPSPAVSESPVPRLPSPTSSYAHARTTSARFTQAVKSMMPSGPRRNSSAASGPPPEIHRERAKSPTRFLSLVDRRAAASPPLPHTSTSEFLTRAPRNAQPKESLVLQRARAYEQTIATNHTPGTEAHSSFILPPLPQMPSMAGVAEAIEKSKVTFP